MKMLLRIAFTVWGVLLSFGVQAHSKSPTPLPSADSVRTDSTKSRRVVFTVASRSACVFVLSVCTESAEGSGVGEFEWAWTPKLSMPRVDVSAVDGLRLRP